MPRLVHERVHVVGDANGVHEDERLAPEAELRAIPARSFPLPALQIEQPIRRHQRELAAERRVDPAEDRLRSVDERANVVERLERLDALELHPQVPRSHAIEPKSLAAVLELARHGGNDRLLHRVVEAVAVRGRVVEAVLGLERVLLIVREAGVARHLRPRDEHLVEQSRELVAAREICFVAKSPRALADLAIAFLEVRLQLRDRLGLTFPLCRQPTHDLLVLRGELLELGEQGNVFFAEDLGVGAEPLDGRLEAGSGVVEVQ
jgi:hypothetical protein